MSAENKAVLRRWFEEVWNQGRVATIDELFAADGIAHGLGPDIHGPGEFKPFQATFREAFPNLHIRMDDVIAEGDQVAYRWTATARHDGKLRSLAPTGRSSTFTGMGMVRVKNGQIVEAFNLFDQLSMYHQLGVVEMPA